MALQIRRTLLSIRTVESILTAQDAMDGAGVKIKRHSLVNRSLADPFLLLDEIRSDDAQDFMAAFLRIHTAVSKPLLTCEKVAFSTKITWAIRVKY